MRQKLESIAANLIEKYPDGYLSEIVIEQPLCGIAVRAPLHGLNTPRTIVQGTYNELRAFENTYNRIKGLEISSPSSHMSALVMDYAAIDEVS